MPLLGCIADDFTGGTDLANNLVKSGFRTVQTIGIPKSTTQLENSDAVVVALKTRTRKRSIGWNPLAANSSILSIAQPSTQPPAAILGP